MVIASGPSRIWRPGDGVMRGSPTYRASPASPGFEDFPMHEEDGCEHNATLLSNALLDGNVKLRLTTTRVDKIIPFGGTVGLVNVVGPQVDLNTNIAYWHRAANQTYRASSPGPNGEIEWDPTGGEGPNPASLRSHFDWSGCTDGLIKNGTIQGLNTNGVFDSVLEKEAAVVFRNCPATYADGLTFKMVYGDGIMLRNTSTFLGPSLKVCEWNRLTNLTCHTIGRMQAALTDFFDLVVDGFYTHIDSSYTKDGVYYPASGKSGRSAFDIEKTKRASFWPADILAESARARIKNFTVGADNFALAVGGAGYVHDIDFGGEEGNLSTCRDLGQNIATVLGRDDNSFAWRSKFEIHHINWPEVGGANNALGGEFVRDWFKVHHITANESNMGAGKNGVGLQECEGVDLHDNGFTGGFTTQYVDDLTASAQTPGIVPVTVTDGGASSFSAGAWGTAVAEAWANPGNAARDVNGDAIVTLDAGQKTNDLRCTALGISLPVGATVTGIELRVKGRQTDGTGVLIGQLVIGGVLVGTTAAGSLGLATANNLIPSSGSETHLWGLTPTKAQVEAADFGFYVAALQGGPVFVNEVSVRVYYQYPVGPSTIVNCANNVPACP